MLYLYVITSNCVYEYAPCFCTPFSLPATFLLLHTRSNPSHIQVNMPRNTSTNQTRIHCGCFKCERSGKQTVSRSTYKRHKKHRDDGLSARFNHFIDAQTCISIPESETPNSPSDDNIPMPFNSKDDIDHMVRYFLPAIITLIH